LWGLERSFQLSAESMAAPIMNIQWIVNVKYMKRRAITERAITVGFFFVFILVFGISSFFLIFFMSFMNLQNYL